ncbi:MAG: sulfide/dihydroorotate dehydrogenase-like FAD/NAD-binding protein [bacterium]
MYKIIEKHELAPNIFSLTLYSPEIAAKIKAGQFVMVRVDEKGERIPFTITDWDADKGTVSVVFVTLGTSTCKLSALKESDSVLNFVGPLGKPTEIENFGTVICVGGCYGIGAISPIARALKAKGNKVISIIEARNKRLLYWEDRIRTVSDSLFTVTRDGSSGYSGHIAEFLDKFIKDKKLLDEALKGSYPAPMGTNKIDRIIVIGCTFMMKLCADVTRASGIKTIVALDPIMVDGTGMCGACRVSVGGETKFACVDGPEFDAHQVDWDLLFIRRSMYLKEEMRSLQEWECEFYP